MDVGLLDLTNNSGHPTKCEFEMDNNNKNILYV